MGCFTPDNTIWGAYANFFDRSSSYRNRSDRYRYLKTLLGADGAEPRGNTGLIRKALPPFDSYKSPIFRIVSSFHLSSPKFALVIG